VLVSLFQISPKPLFGAGYQKAANKLKESHMWKNNDSLRSWLNSGGLAFNSRGTYGKTPWIAVLLYVYIIYLYAV